MTTVISPTVFQREAPRWLGIVRGGEDVIVEPTVGGEPPVLITLLERAVDPIADAIRSGWAKPPRNPNAGANGFPVLDIPADQARAMIAAFENERAFDY